MPRPGLSPAVLVTEAAGLADQHGYDALSLSALADRVGVRPPSLYKHLGGLDDLRLRLARAGLDEAGRRLRAAVRDRRGRAALDALCTGYRAFAREHPGLYAATVRAPRQGEPELQAAAAEATDALLDVVRGYGVADPAEAVHAARLVRSALHGFAALEAAGGFGLPESVDQSFLRLVEGLDAALVRAASSDR